jgi:hypothetical protein
MLTAAMLIGTSKSPESLVATGISLFGDTNDNVDILIDTRGTFTDLESRLGRA